MCCSFGAAFILLFMICDHNKKSAHSDDAIIWQRNLSREIERKKLVCWDNELFYFVVFQNDEREYSIKKNRKKQQNLPSKFFLLNWNAFFPQSITDQTIHFRYITISNFVFIFNKHKFFILSWLLTKKNLATLKQLTGLYNGMHLFEWFFGHLQKLSLHIFFLYISLLHFMLHKYEYISGEKNWIEHLEDISVFFFILCKKKKIRNEL